MRRAFTVVETLIAFVILGFALLPVIALFSTAGDQARQTSDHALAVVLDEQIAEMVRAEAWENVHFGERLADPALRAPRAVVDGESPFFATVEDDVAPFGRIDAGVDHPVIAQMGALYPALRSFRVGVVASRRALPTTGVVHDLDLNMEWRDYQRKLRELDLRVTVGEYGPGFPPQPVPLDRAAADTAIARAFYRATGLTAAVAAVRADLTAVRDLGDVGVLLGASSAAEQRYGADLNQLTAAVTAAGSPTDEARAQLALARRMETQVVATLETMTYLARPLEDLARGFTRAQLGAPAVPERAYRGSMIAAAWYPSELGDAIEGTMEAYARACNDPLGKTLPPRTRIRAQLKLVELAKLMALTCGPADVTYLRGLLTDFRREMDGHNPNFVHYADAELTRCADLDALRRSYAVPDRVTVWTRYMAAVVPAVNRVLAAR